MLEEPKIKKVDKKDKQLPQNFEQLIEMYDVEKIWPFILKTIQFINKEIPEDFKKIIEKYSLDDMLSLFKAASKLIDFNASGKGMAFGKFSEKDALEIGIPMEISNMEIYVGDLNDIATTKVVYSDSGGANKPANVNGYCCTLVVTTNYRKQIYYVQTLGGSYTYERAYSEGTWSGWQQSVVAGTPISGTFNRGSWNTPTRGLITQVTDNSGGQHSVMVGLKSDGKTRLYGIDLFDDDSTPVMALYAGSGYVELDKDGQLTAYGLLRSYHNGNYVTIGSQNSTCCHIYNSANIPFYFNRDILVNGYRAETRIAIYGNSSGTTGTVTLSMSVSNFLYLDIYYKNADGQYGSTRVYGLEGGKTTYGTIIRTTSSGDTLLVNSALFTISGTTISISRNMQGNMVFGGSNNKDNNTLAITSVFGVY